MSDPFTLARFEAAQQGIFESAIAEIKQGRKRSHWMWFIFPQIHGLGSSRLAHEFGISSLAEARTYLDHPVLSKRLQAAVGALQDLPETPAEQVFGAVDAVKLRSSLTLFSEAGGGLLFQAALERWFSGERDAATLDMIEATT